MKRITAEMLEAHEACEEDLAKFKQEWPEGCEVTVENGMRAIALGLDIEFLADALPDMAWEEFYNRSRSLRDDYRARFHEISGSVFSEDGWIVGHSTRTPERQAALDALSVERQVQVLPILVEVINEWGFCVADWRYSEDDGDAKFEQEGDR